MFISEDEHPDSRVSTIAALRHVLVFQLKLAADALRDFVLSPLSVLAFLVDALRKPRMKDSLYLRLMLLGRRSDRFINLFDEYQDSGSLTIDHAVDELEVMLRAAQNGSGPADAAGPAGERD